MRTIRRFTPNLIRKWSTDHLRGIGTHSDYLPWHQVSRSDPASLGRSHLTYCPLKKRMRHQLSDNEQVVLGLILMIPDQFDIREQYPLATHEHLHELSKYNQNYHLVVSSGTVDYANSLGIRPPKVKSKNDQEHWRLTTDFVITLKCGDSYQLIGIACKEMKELLNKRKRDLLTIEKHYWESEGGQWLLITEQQIDPYVRSTILRSLSWVIHPEQVALKLKEECGLLKEAISDQPLTYGLSVLAGHFQVEMQTAQNIFWQSVWSGHLPISLKRRHFASEKVVFLSEEDFKKQNPVFARRSAWI